MKRIFIEKVDEHVKKYEKPFYLGVVGSRSFPDEAMVYENIEAFISENRVNISRESYVIVSGGAKGVDTFAKRYAEKNALQSIIIKPDWGRYGRAAGFRRNTEIAKLSDVVLAFVDKDKGGTWDTIRKAQKMGKPVYIFDIRTWTRTSSSSNMPQ